MSEPEWVRLWREKLDFLLAEQVTAVAPDHKFNLRKRIEEARAKLAEWRPPVYGLGGRVELPDPLAELEAELGQRRLDGLDTQAVTDAMLDIRRQRRAGRRIESGDYLLGRYRIDERLGRGGFASVWKAYDHHTKRVVAVKVLHGDHAEDRSRVERFCRGAMQMKALHHGAIVPILEEPAQCEHHRFFVMPWFAGGDLERAVAAGELAVAEALEAVARALEGLAHAHESGLVHRDVKPSNILLDERGRGLIADFDLVRADDTTRGTRTNAGMGSLRWAAPEQLNDAREADARADVYGAALCVLYVLKRVVPPVFVTLTEPRYLDDLGCSRGLRDALRGALAYDPDARTTTCALLVAAIRANTHDDDPEGEKPAWATAAGSDGYGMWASFRVGEVEQRMRWIEPGTFMMGSPSDEPGWLDREGPQHEVTLTQGYWMAETPCTQALWEAVMGANPSGFKSPARPVEGVSWDDVGRFLEQLEQRVPGLGVGLPTEAQWEYACRAGTETATYAGAIELLGGCHAPVLDEIAWYGGNSGVGFDLPNGYDSSDWSEKQYPHTRAGTRTVKQKRPNSWGLHDMLGNVWEWCLDGNRAYDVSPVSDPVGPDGPSRVYRGGGWHCDARRVRAANRGWNAPGFRYDYLGFRLVRGQKQRS